MSFDAGHHRSSIRDIFFLFRVDINARRASYCWQRRTENRETERIQSLQESRVTFFSNNSIALLDSDKDLAKIVELRTLVSGRSKARSKDCCIRKDLYIGPAYRIVREKTETRL